MRCKHEWIPRTEQPVCCPKCRSPYWNKERRRGDNLVPSTPLTVSENREEEPPRLTHSKQKELLDRMDKQLSDLSED